MSSDVGTSPRVMLAVRFRLRLAGSSRVGHALFSFESLFNTLLFAAHRAIYHARPYPPGQPSGGDRDRVTVGRAIAEVCNSGNTTKPHVHIHAFNLPSLDLANDDLAELLRTARIYPPVFRDVVLTRNGPASSPVWATHAVATSLGRCHDKLCRSLP